jgi:hypothetical protein
VNGPVKSVPAILHEPVAWDILQYLIRHPQARDSLKGVVHWWLPLQRIEAKVAEVESVLEQLVNRGWIMKSVSHRQSYFGINEKREKEIRAWLDVHSRR